MIVDVIPAPLIDDEKVTSHVYDGSGVKRWQRGYIYDG